MCVFVWNRKKIEFNARIVKHFQIGVGPSQMNENDDSMPMICKPFEKEMMVINPK